MQPKVHKVAVITRTKDRPILLWRAMTSIAQQTMKDYIWIIVNDGGEKDAVEKVSEAAKQQSIDLKVHHNRKSVGMEAASNIGIKISNSEFIVIHDDDDSWDPSFLEKTTHFLDKKNNYFGVVTLTTQVLEDFDGKCVIEKEFKAFNPWMQSIYLIDIVKQNIFPPISVIFRRKIFDTIGYYNEKLPVLGDWEFNLRFLERFDIGVIYEPLAFYHHRETLEGVYGNTVYDGVSKHIEYDAIIRNSLLRKDLGNSSFGLGMLVNLGRYQLILDQRILVAEKLLNFVKRIMEKTGFRKIVRFCFRI